MGPEDEERWKEFVRLVNSGSTTFSEDTIKMFTKSINDFVDEMNRQEEERIRARAQWEQMFRAFNQTFTSSHTGGSRGNGYYTYNPNIYTQQPPTSNALAKLAQLAGVEGVDNEPKAIRSAYRKAQRKCHPDTGGSHEKWLELQKLEYLIR